MLGILIFMVILDDFMGFKDYLNLIIPSDDFTPRINHGISWDSMVTWLTWLTAAMARDIFSYV